MNTKILALTAAQCFYWFATLVGISLSAIVGVELSPRPELATLPFALSSLGGLLSTYPLALYMQHQNRRAGLRLGAAVGAIAAFICCLALQGASFSLFCIGSLMMGIYQASSAYYRLAALDESPTDKQASAMSWVLGGSLLAAVAGPSVAQVARALPWGAAYTGPYLLVAAFSLAAFFTLGVLGQQSTTAPIRSKGQLKALARNRNYLLGLSNTAVAQLLMMLMMVIAPLAMHRQGYSVALSLSVIGWHIVGMFLPSLFSGKLIDRFGPRWAVWAGIAIYAGSAFVALTGNNPAHYYSSLFLLGVGWNFMYSAGTLLYNGSLPADIRAKGQGLAELAVALAGALAVLSGGILITLQSWAQINRISLVVLAIALLVNVALGTRDKTD